MLLQIYTYIIYLQKVIVDLEDKILLSCFDSVNAKQKPQNMRPIEAAVKMAVVHLFNRRKSDVKLKPRSAGACLYSYIPLLCNYSLIMSVMCMYSHQYIISSNYKLIMIHMSGKSIMMSI